MIAYEQEAARLRRLVTPEKRVLLTLTHGLDGDSIGSLVAMGHALDQMNVSWFAYVPEDVPDMFSYLVKKRRVMRDLEDEVHAYDLVILFDTGDVKRTPLVEHFISRQREHTRVINIDHHPTTTDFQGQSAVDINIVDTGAASTTEMLYHLFHHLGIRFSHHIATSLLTGLLTDTGHFSNPATTMGAMDVAAKLMAYGADHRTITQATMQNKSIATLKLWGRALSRLDYNPSSGIVSTVITLQDLEECGADADATTGIANFMTTLSDGKVALVLQEEPNGMVKGSLRTTSSINVADIAKKFHGGGHPKAAGFKIKGKLVHNGLGWQVEKE